MACSGEDILNIDIDTDLLVALVGKLSLNNIPDFAETLQCLDNIALQDNNASSLFASLQCDIPSFNISSESSSSSLNLPNSSSCDPLQCNVSSLNHPIESSCSSSPLIFNNNSLSAPLQCGASSFNHPIESSCSNSLLSPNNNESKDGFLSAIGLLSSPDTTQTRNSPSPVYDSLDDSSNYCDNSVFVASGHKELCRTKEKRAKNKKASSKKKANRKVDFIENSTCDNADSHFHKLPFFSGANFPHKSVDNLRDVFAAGGMVYDIQLSDIGSSSKLPFNAYDEAEEAPISSLNQDHSDNILLQSDKSDDLVKKSNCSHVLRDGENVPHTSVDNLQDVFAACMVYDIQLSDIDNSSNLPFNAYDEANEALCSSLNQDHCGNMLLQSDKSDLVEKSICSHVLRDGENVPHKSVDNLQGVFAVGEKVCDIRLNNIGGSSKFPFTANEAPTSSVNQEPCDNILPQSDKSDDSVEKSACSPDSGISTSPCPGPVSPFSPQTDDSEEYDESHYEDDLEMLLAELIEIENSLKCEETPQSNAHVPVLRDSESAEDHKERIINFLKEPIFEDLKCQLSQLKGDDDKPSFPEFLWETAAESDCTVSSKTTKKPSSRSKKHKLGMEFKSAVKNELGRHSSIFSKGKHFSSRSKILKQIQDDERIQKQVKRIQKLIVSKKLKRIDIDDRENENKKRRVTEPCDKPLEKLE